MNQTSYTSVNPHNPDDVVATAAFADSDEVDVLIAHAREARAAWTRTPAPARGALLHEIALLLEREAEALAELITREVGKPITEARGEVRRACDIHRYYAQVALLPDGETYPSASQASWTFARRYPVGVCLLITPWNFPLAIPSWKAAPALAYGNVVVLKPSPAATAVARRYAELAGSVLPPSVFSLLEGDSEVGEALVRHPDVHAISFTGSRPVGMQVALRALERAAHFQCELSGHNASVVLADADVDLAARTIAGAAMGYAGQKCTATSRIIVETGVRDAFRERLLEAVSALKVVDPTDESCAVGPVISDGARDSALQAIGAIDGKVLAGGAPLDAPGFYLAPTLVEVEEPRYAVRSEIFAPVALISEASDPDDALAQANLGEYGLVTAVFTRDIGRAMAFVDHLEVGLARINASTAGVDFHLPFGGTKGSGIGPREQGLAAREFYTELRTVLISA